MKLVFGSAALCGDRLREGCGPGFGGCAAAAKQPATFGELAIHIARGQDSIVPDANEAPGQDMQQKPTNEFVGVQRHLFPTPAIGVVLVTEHNAAMLQRDQAVVGDRHAMGIPSERKVKKLNRR